MKYLLLLTTFSLFAAQHDPYGYPWCPSSSVGSSTGVYYDHNPRYQHYKPADNCPFITDSQTLGQFDYLSAATQTAPTLTFVGICAYLCCWRYRKKR